MNKPVGTAAQSIAPACSRAPTDKLSFLPPNPDLLLALPTRQLTEQSRLRQPGPPPQDSAPQRLIGTSARRRPNYRHQPEFYQNRP